MSNILKDVNYTREQLKQIEAQAEENYKNMSEEDKEYIRSHSIHESYEYLSKKEFKNN